MRRSLFAVVAFVFLTGCSPAAVIAVGGGVSFVADAYCNGLSEEAKQALRDMATRGNKIVACQEPIQ